MRIIYFVFFFLDLPPLFGDVVVNPRFRKDGDLGGERRGEMWGDRCMFSIMLMTDPVCLVSRVKRSTSIIVVLS